MSRAAELTLKLLDGTLSDADARELDAFLAADLGAEHVALLELEAALRGLRTDFDLSDATLAKLLEAQAERTADAVLCEIADLAPPPWSQCAEPAVPSGGARGSPSRWRVFVPRSYFSPRGSAAGRAKSRRPTTPLTGFRWRSPNCPARTG